MPKEFCDRSFWRNRIVDAISRGEIHRCMYETNLQTWKQIQTESRSIISKLVIPSETILDVGCGIGYLTECINTPKENYTGIDISPDLIALANIYYPEYKFEIGDCRLLPYASKRFNWSIARSLTGSLEAIDGAYKQCMFELRRVAKYTLILNLTLTNTYELYEND